MLFETLRRHRQKNQAAACLYRTLVEQARLPEFYTIGQVPDTLDGRFNLVLIHAILLIDRLGQFGPEGKILAQALFDYAFEDFDRSIREIGSGDMGVGKRIKIMAQSFYGRMTAYQPSLHTVCAASKITEEAEINLKAALRRNLYGKQDPDSTLLKAMTHYILNEALLLATCDPSALIIGRWRFSAPLFSQK